MGAAILTLLPLTRTSQQSPDWPGPQYVDTKLASIILGIQIGVTMPVEPPSYLQSPISSFPPHLHWLQCLTDIPWVN